MELIKHNKTNKTYLKLFTTKVKIGGLWVPAIIYVCLYWNKDGMIWVRTKKDFEQNFSN